MTIDPTSKFLFVVDSYAPGFNGVAPPNINPLQTNTVPTQGCVVVIPSTRRTARWVLRSLEMTETASPLGRPLLGRKPIGVTATAFVDYLYVADQGTHSVYAYSVNYTGGGASDSAGCQ